MSESASLLTLAPVAAFPHIAMALPNNRQRSIRTNLCRGCVAHMITAGCVSWFKFDKKFGFLALDDDSGDAFLHVSVLTAAGYVSVPAGTAMRVRVEEEQGRRRVVEVLDVDTSSARPGEPPAVLRR